MPWGKNRSSRDRFDDSIPAGNKAADVAGKSSNQASKKLSAATVKNTFGETDSYVVRKGDTLNSISKKVGLDKETMTRNCLHTSGLKIGQILVLRKDVSRPDDKEAEESGMGMNHQKANQPPPPLGKWNNPKERAPSGKGCEGTLGGAVQIRRLYIKGNRLFCLGKKDLRGF